MQKRTEMRIVLALVACLGTGVVGTAVAQEGGLGSCEGRKIVTWMSSTRSETINDIQQSWVGGELSKLVASWGAPSSTFENRDGTRILTWKDDDWSNCSKTFEVDSQDVVTRWNNRDCQCSRGKSGIPKGTPIPRTTL